MTVCADIREGCKTRPIPRASCKKYAFYFKCNEKSVEGFGRGKGRMVR